MGGKVSRSGERAGLQPGAGACPREAGVEAATWLRTQGQRRAGLGPGGCLRGGTAKHRRGGSPVEGVAAGTEGKEVKVAAVPGFGARWERGDQQVC